MIIPISIRNPLTYAQRIDEIGNLRTSVLMVSNWTLQRIMSISNRDFHVTLLVNALCSAICVSAKFVSLRHMAQLP